MKLRTARRRQRGKDADREVKRLRALLSEVYAAAGALLDLDHPGAVRLLDNVLAGAEGRPLPHPTILPTWTK